MLVSSEYWGVVHFGEFSHGRRSQVFFIVAAVLLTANSIWEVVTFLDRGFSLGVGMVLIANSIRVKLIITTIAQCHDLIEKLINRDAELIRRVNDFKNV